MWGKIVDLFALFRKGNELANAEVWKDRANLLTILVPFIMALVKIAGDFGYAVQLSTEDASNIALGIVAVVQFVIHNITSKRAGVLPAAEPKPDSSSDSSEQRQLPTESKPATVAKAGVVIEPLAKPTESKPQVVVQPQPAPNVFDESFYKGG